MKQKTSIKSKKLSKKQNTKRELKTSKNKTKSKTKEKNIFDSMKEKTSKFFKPLNERVKHSTQKGWCATKQYSKIIEQKTVDFSKKVFFASVKLCLTFSEKSQCPDCKTINEPVSHVWENITNGFNNIGKPTPDFGRKLNSYKCTKCKKEYEKKLLKKEAICPCCGSLKCMLETDGEKIYMDEKTAKYKDHNVSIGLFKSYPWGVRVVDLHQIFYCKKCGLEFWQYKSESIRNCCPHCHTLGDAQKETFVEDVSTYSKSEVVAHRTRYIGNNTTREEPIYGEVAYEHGYETTLYRCTACNKVVYRSSGWYDRKL